jgi:hypothetical protein
LFLGKNIQQKLCVLPSPLSIIFHPFPTLIFAISTFTTIFVTVVTVVTAVVAVFATGAP